MNFNIECLEQAKAELSAVTEQLLQLDPYWKKCFPCKSQGKCCIGADPRFSQPDLEAVFNLSTTFSETDKMVLSSNIHNRQLCPFRGKDKCLINAVRTLDCLYTPFQAVITARQTIMYSMITDSCDFKVVDVPIQQIKYELKEDAFILLPSFGCIRHYILLNQLNFINSNYPEICSATAVAKQMLQNI